MLFSFSFFGWLNKKPATAWAIAGFEKFLSLVYIKISFPRHPKDGSNASTWPLSQ
jgi:hypothetical protein